MLRHFTAAAALAVVVPALIAIPVNEAQAAAACQKGSAKCKASAKRRAPARKSVVDTAKWGPLADLVGPVWHAPGALLSYSWTEPGKVLTATDLVSRSQAVFTLKPDGTIEETSVPSAFSASPATTMIHSIDETGVLVGGSVDGAWHRTLQRRDDQLITGASYKGADMAIVAMRPLTAEELDLLKTFHDTAAQPDAIARNWGVAANFIGAVWEHKSFGDRDLVTYSWLEPGVFMAKSVAKVLNDAQRVEQPDYQIIGFDPISRTTTERYTVAEPGLVRGAALSDPIGDARWEIVFEDADHCKEVFYSRKKGQLKRTLTSNYKRIHGTDMETRLAAVIKDETDNRFSLGGGFADMVMGAVMGAATGYANANGDVAGAIVGGMSGAAIGKSGGDAALYSEMKSTQARVEAEAAASKARLDRTIADAQRQAEQQRAATARASSTGTKPGGAAQSPAPSVAVAAARPAPVAPTTVASPPAPEPQRTITQYVWCYARLQPLGKFGDEYYSNISKVTITSEQSHQKFLEEGVYENWLEYIGGVAGVSRSGDYSYCRKYDSEGEAAKWLADEKRSWGRYAPLHQQAYFPHY